MMNPREEALNKLINYDNGYAAHTVRPSQLRIDFFRDFLQYYIELGIAYLEKRVKEKFIPYELSDKLKHIKDLQFIGLLKNDEICVDIMGVEDNDFSKFLEFSDGTHRTITVLSTLNRNDRYLDVTTAKSDRELIEWAKKNYRGKLTRKRRKIKLKKKKGGITVKNKNPAKLPSFPFNKTEEQD